MHLLEPTGAVRLRIGAVGDIGLVGGARLAAQARGYAEVLAPIADVFRSLDLTFANLEFPVADASWIQKGRTQAFWHEPALTRGLAEAGVQVVSLANNHMLDAGPRGLRRTLDTCRGAGLYTVGAGMSLDEAREPVRLTVRGRRVVVLAYAAVAEPDRARADRPGVAPLESELIREDLARWRPHCDTLVVSAHWGTMYVEPPPARVMQLANELTDAGADLVLGHHPHVLQGFRRSGGRLTLFSLGDAAFNNRSGELDIEWTRAKRRRSGVFVALMADQPGLVFKGLILDDDGLPRAAGDDVSRVIGDRLVELSSDWDRADERFHEEAVPQLLRYEFGALAGFIRQGRIGHAARLLASVRPRHLPMLLSGLRSRLQ